MPGHFRKHSLSHLALQGSAILVPIALSAAALAANDETAAGQPEVRKATISVDFAKIRGLRYRAERVNNFSSAPFFAEQRPSDVEFYNEQGLHGDVYRVWIRAQDIFDPATGTYDYKEMDTYLANASKISDRLLGVMDTRVAIRDMHYTPDQVKVLVKKIMTDLKKRHPKLVYIEAFNEPDYNLSKALNPDQLYDYYKVYYEAVSEINAELHPKMPLQIGGPGFMVYNAEWMKAFLDSYKADPSPAKRIDFLSWHAYGEFPGGYHGTQGPRAYHFYKGDPSEVAGQRAKLDALLRESGLDPNTPSFITELGIYPGPSFDHISNPHADYIIQAAGVASLIYWFMEQPHMVPFNWVVRHGGEERKDQMLTRLGKDKPIPTRIFTPYGNSLLMMSKLKDERVSATSNALQDGKGVYAIATKDKTGTAVMAWNYQHVGQTSYAVTIDLAHLPSALQGKTVCERNYRIDDKVSNYWGDPSRANLQMISAQRIKVGERPTVKFDLTPNAFQLVSLAPSSACPRKIRD